MPRPITSTMSENAGIESMNVATLALEVRRSIAMHCLFPFFWEDPKSHPLVIVI
jgi:hypothetical protein